MNLVPITIRFITSQPPMLLFHVIMLRTYSTKIIMMIKTQAMKQHWVTLCAVELPTISRR
jgi:hypothetical protein